MASSSRILFLKVSSSSSSSIYRRTTTCCSLLFPFHFIPQSPKTQLKPFSPTANYRVVTAATTQGDNPKPTAQVPSTSLPPSPPATINRWRPMCLYHTQGKCTMLDDPAHLEKFNHDFSRDLNVDAACLGPKHPQGFDHFLVLDLEGKVEILEFPVLLIDAKTMRVLDLFHRFVMPSGMSQQRVDEYIANKYGKFGVDRVWHDTAVPFNEVIQQFETWLNGHHLWEKKDGGSLKRAAFVTCFLWWYRVLICFLAVCYGARNSYWILSCIKLVFNRCPAVVTLFTFRCFLHYNSSKFFCSGISGNWDVKTKVPQQCKVARMKIPPYFMEWINLKDAYKNFYNPEIEARGMRTMMEQLRLPMLGSHHLGIDDTKNIARVLLRMLADGAVLALTAWRNPDSFEDVRFLYNNRIV